MGVGSQVKSRIDKTNPNVPINYRIGALLHISQSLTCIRRKERRRRRRKKKKTEEHRQRAGEPEEEAEEAAAEEEKQTEKIAATDAGK